MTQWLVLYRKEMLELWRSMKWLWVPVVFVILGVMQPISSYYLPDILKSAGNLPEGAIIQIPTPSSLEVLAQTISQYGTMGVLILVLSSMGIVAGERQSGVAAMILVKPVPHASFITAKWAAASTLTLASFAAGFAAAWYYTVILFGEVPIAQTLQGFAAYALWLMFVITVTVTMSALFKGNGAIAFISIGSIALLTIISGLLTRYLSWSPSKLADYAGNLLLTGKAGESLPYAIGISLAAMAVLLVLAIAGFKRKELVES